MTDFVTGDLFSTQKFTILYSKKLATFLYSFGGAHLS